LPNFLEKNSVNKVSSKIIDEVSKINAVRVPIILALAGIPWELIENSTATQQAVMLKIVQDYNKDKSDIITSAVWKPFVK